MQQFPTAKAATVAAALLAVLAMQLRMAFQDLWK